MSNSDRLKNIFLSIIFILPILIYSLIQYIYSLNIPRWDDYLAILNFLNKYLECYNFWEKINLIFSQHNEHRIVFTRIITLLQYYYFGSVNFQILSFIGNMGWYFIILLFFIEFKKLKYPIFYFLPVVFLTFQLCHYENIDWATASLSNNYVILFSFYSIYLIIVKNNLLYSCFLLILATFTTGAGIFSALVISLNLFFEKKWKQLFIILSLLSILSLIYFLNYSKPENHPSVIEAVKNIGNMIVYFFAFLGSFIRYKWAAIFIGLLLFIFYIYMIYKKYYNEYRFFFLILSYIILTGFFLSLARSGFGFQQATSSRYTIYSSLFLITIYLIMLQQFIKKFGIVSYHVKYFVRIILSISIIYYFSINIFAFKKIKSKYNDLLYSAYNYECLDRIDTLNYPDKNLAESIIKTSQVKGIYYLKDGMLNKCK